MLIAWCCYFWQLIWLELHVLSRIQLKSWREQPLLLAVNKWGHLQWRQGDGMATQIYSQGLVKCRQPGIILERFQAEECWGWWVAWWFLFFFVFCFFFLIRALALLSLHKVLVLLVQQFWQHCFDVASDKNYCEKQAFSALAVLSRWKHLDSPRLLLFSFELSHFANEHKGNFVDGMVPSFEIDVRYPIQIQF